MLLDIQVSLCQLFSNMFIQHDMEMIICKLSIDRMQKKMHKEFTEIMVTENKNSIFPDQFLNMDFSVDLPRAILVDA